MPITEAGVLIRMPSDGSKGAAKMLFLDPESLDKLQDYWGLRGCPQF
jgi:hypothetical protein